MTSSQSDSPYLGLLRRKMKQAEETMAKMMEDQLLYGRSTVSISNGTVSHVPQENIITPYPYRTSWTDAYKTKITDNIFRESPVMEYITKQSERKNPMSDTSAIVSKVAAERKEARAKELFEKLDAHFGAVDYIEGDVVLWNAEFESSDKVYRYVAIRGDKFWYISRDTNEYTTEELIAKIVTLAIDGTVYFDGQDDIL